MRRSSFKIKNQISNLKKMNKFKEKFNKVAVPGMNKKFGYKNVLAMPKIIKVVVSAGIGSFKDEAKKKRP